MKVKLTYYPHELNVINYVESTGYILVDTPHSEEWYSVNSYCIEYIKEGELNG